MLIDNSTKWICMVLILSCTVCAKFDAQFFQLETPPSLADDLRSGFEAGQMIRKIEQKKLFDRLFTKHLNDSGYISLSCFLKDAKYEGLDSDYMIQIINYPKLLR